MRESITWREIRRDIYSNYMPLRFIDPEFEVYAKYLKAIL
jgi:hypothetical protein